MNNHCTERSVMKVGRILTIGFLVSFLSYAAVSQSGKKAADFTLETVDGKKITLSELRGKVVLVNFWATWCGPCVKEIPDFLKVYEAYKSKGFEIVGISLDRGGWKQVTPFVERMKISYPVVIGDARLVEAYGNFNAIPTTFLLDKNGNIVTKHTGLMTKAQLEEHLNRLL